jgi:hypothetical protein
MPAAAERGLSLPKNRAAETGEAMTVSVAVPGPDSDAGEGKSAVPTPQPEQEQVALSPVLWLDPDVRWLCGVHEAEGHFYLVRELYEELLWWLLMPALLRLAGEPAPSRAAVKELSKTVATALSSAEAAGYRINTLLGSLAASETVVSDETAESPALESEPPELTPPAASAPDAET